MLPRPPAGNCDSTLSLAHQPPNAAEPTLARIATATTTLGVLLRSGASATSPSMRCWPGPVRRRRRRRRTVAALASRWTRSRMQSRRRRPSRCRRPAPTSRDRQLLFTGVRRYVHGHPAGSAVVGPMPGPALDALAWMPAHDDLVRSELVPVRAPLRGDLDDGYAVDGATRH